jgi:hypothetical protein
VWSVNYNYPTPGPSAPYLTFLPMSFLGITGDIDAAFSDWTANRFVNGSLVGFQAGGSNGPFRIYAYQVNFPGVAFLDPGKAAYTYTALYSGPNQIAFVSTELYFGSISTVGGYPTYDQTIPLMYHAFVKKVMLHEIGHTMDLDDQPSNPGLVCGGQTAGESVMNVQCGSNDVASNMSSFITSCDNASAN